MEVGFFPSQRPPWKWRTNWEQLRYFLCAQLHQPVQVLRARDWWEHPSTPQCHRCNLLRSWLIWMSTPQIWNLNVCSLHMIKIKVVLLCDWKCVLLCMFKYSISLCLPVTQKLSTLPPEKKKKNIYRNRRHMYLFKYIFKTRQMNNKPHIYPIYINLRHMMPYGHLSSLPRSISPFSSNRFDMFWPSDAPRTSSCRRCDSSGWSPAPSRRERTPFREEVTTGVTFGEMFANFGGG